MTLTTAELIRLIVALAYSIRLNKRRKMMELAFSIATSLLILSCGILHLNLAKLTNLEPERIEEDSL